MKLSKQHAIDLAREEEEPDQGYTVESNEQIDQTRWASIHQLVIRDSDGRLWSAEYQKGLTENQDIEPFDEDGPEIDFHEVEKVPVQRFEYRRISS
jgi:hypothetical protein